MKQQLALCAGPGEKSTLASAAPAIKVRARMNSSTLKIVVAVAIIAVVAFQVFRYKGKSAKPTIQLGPIRHQSLPETLIARIRQIEPILAEVYPRSHEQWLEGFMRDVDPEPEVANWEAIASAYGRFTQNRALSLEAKRETLMLLIMRSVVDENTTVNSKLVYLNRAEAKELLHLYSEPPQPILIQSK
ncbi:MAG: hypothetical protein JWR26_171 [Pedosphaera sp.]|nr:hypothetical protein [Pedosphaera sp.]